MSSRLGVAMLVVGLLAGCGGESEPGAEPAAPLVEAASVPVLAFDPTRDAQADIDAALAEAKRSGRRVLLDVGGDWCVWCHKLDEFFEQNPDLADFLHDNFVVVKINFSEENPNEEVLSQFPPVAGYPHFFVLDADGNLLHSQNTGDLETGPAHDRAKVEAFLRKWAPS